MSAGLPAALVGASLGLALSFASLRGRILALPAVVLSAIVAWMFAPSFVPLGSTPFLACGVCIVVAATAVFLARRIVTCVALALATATGACVGVVVAVAGQPADLPLPLALILLMVPGGWLVASGRQIALKVVASWLTAIALLSAALPLTPTPGYEPDHFQ